MNPTRAQRRIRDLVRQGRYRITGYCGLRMLERGISPDEVVAVLKRSSGCWRQTNDRWKLEGTDSNGESLFAFVELQAAVVIVNTFRGDEDDEDEPG